MQKIIKLSCLLVMLSGCHAFGQSNEIQAHFKTGNIDFNEAFTKKYNEASANSQLPGCLSSVIFAKFTIDTLGNVDSLTFYENDGTPKIFREILTAAIQASNGKWVPATIKGKKIESKPFILPLLYELESGCQIPVKPFDTDNALLHFWNDVVIANHGPFNCILLSPFNIFSQR